MNLSSDVMIFLQVLLAMGLGSVVGLERELADKPAGLRTHILVTGTATLLVLLGDLIISQFAALETGNFIRTDPIRLFQAIIVGISFLGAGTIFRNKAEHTVEGLTTAASLLFMSAVGITVALERTYLAIALTLLVLVVSRGLRWLERLFIERRKTET